MQRRIILIGILAALALAACGQVAAPATQPTVIPTSQSQPTTAALAPRVSVEQGKHVWPNYLQQLPATQFNLNPPIIIKIGETRTVQYETKIGDFKMGSPDFPLDLTASNNKYDVWGVVTHFNGPQGERWYFILVAYLSEKTSTQGTFHSFASPVPVMELDGPPPGWKPDVGLPDVVRPPNTASLPTPPPVDQLSNAQINDQHIVGSSQDILNTLIQRYGGILDERSAEPLENASRTCFTYDYPFKGEACLDSPLQPNVILVVTFKYKDGWYMFPLVHVLDKRADGEFDRKTYINPPIFPIPSPRIILPQKQA